MDHPRSGPLPTQKDVSERRRNDMTMTNGEREFDFTLSLVGASELTDDLANRLYESGCDDATIASRAGRLFASFSRRAASLKDAVLSAIADVRKSGTGADVLRVDDCNLVTQADIARKIGKSRQLVYQYMTGARGPGAFPPPVCAIQDDQQLWDWCEVARWLWQNNMVKQDVLQEAREVEAINSVLGLEHNKREWPELIKEVQQSVVLP